MKNKRINVKGTEIVLYQDNKLDFNSIEFDGIKSKSLINNINL